MSISGGIIILILSFICSKIHVALVPELITEHTFKILPPEIKTEIFSNIFYSSKKNEFIARKSDYQNIRLVCKDFADVVENNQFKENILNKMLTLNTKVEGWLDNETRYLKNESVHFDSFDFSILVSYYGSLFEQRKKDYKFKEKCSWFIQSILSKYILEERIEELIGNQHLYVFLKNHSDDHVAVEIIKGLLTMIVQFYADPHCIKQSKNLGYFYRRYYGSRENYLLKKLQSIKPDTKYKKIDDRTKEFFEAGHNLLYIFPEIKRDFSCYLQITDPFFDQLIVEFSKFKKIMQEIIKPINVHCFLKTTVPHYSVHIDYITFFNDLACVDKQYAAQFFNAFFEQKLNDYYSDEKYALQFFYSLLHTPNLPCPLFYRDKFGVSIYQKLKKLHQDFEKNNVYSFCSVGPNIALEMLRIYVTKISLDGLKEMERDLSNIIDAPNLEKVQKLILQRKWNIVFPCMQKTFHRLLIWWVFFYLISQQKVLKVPINITHIRFLCSFLCGCFTTLLIFKNCKVYR